MVQLPATAAIEYVAACLPGGTFSPVVFWPGEFLSGGAFVRGVFCPGGIFVRGAYARSPQVQCVYEPSRLSVRDCAVVCLASKRDGQTNKKTNSAP